MNEELNNVVEDAVNDAMIDTDASLDAAPDSPAVDTQSDTSATDTPSETSTAPTPEQQNQQAEDSLFGIPRNGVTGRENRIPYSRVQKIVEKAKVEAREAAKKELDGQFSPKLTDYETKVKTYEDQLQRVAEFENVLANDPQRFLGMLSQIPAYKPFFDQLAALAAGQQNAVRDPATGRFVSQQQSQDPDFDYSTMPQPDQQMPDGSMIYSMEGLAKRDAWLARQIEDRAVRNAEKRMSERYAPIEQEFQSQQHIARLVPQIERQISEARTWDRFTDLEPKIVQILKSDRNMSLERAYMKAYHEDVVPKMAADRTKMRTEILEEMKRQPTNTAAPARNYKPAPVASATDARGRRDLSDVIREQISELQ